MPAFRNKLPTDGKHMGFDLRRTPQTAPLIAIVTSDDFIVCDTHFWHGRTLPCERTIYNETGDPEPGTCPPCNAAIPFRSHVYLSAFNAKTHEHFLFECTAHAAKALEEYRTTVGTLRGCVFNASRPKGGKNSKVVITTNTANLSRNPLPDPPDLIKALCVIWRVPAPEHHALGKAFTSGTMEEDATVTKPKPALSRKRLAEQREPPDNDEGEAAFIARRQALTDAITNAAKGNGKPQLKVTAP